jgi:UDP-GlcNAc:undecaprenyl-phosphate GlcNAc-1-phosphate transferase
MTLLIVLFLSMSFTLVATPLLITKLKEKGIVDTPGERRVNTEIIPRMGGIVILFSLLIILFSFYLNLSETRGFLFGILVISICGMIDDVIGLKWNYKFLLQFISALIIIFSLNIQTYDVTIFFINFPGILGQIILLLFIVGLINSINLMDGLDGLVAGYSIAKFAPILFLSIIQGNYLLNLILFSVIGSLFGFLKYNANPAKIFLGDTGALLLGYLLAYSVLAVSPVIKGATSSLDLSFAIILLSVPLIDTLKVFIIRIVKRENPFKPDKLHLHHILLEQKIHHKKVVFFIQLYSLIYIFDSFVYLKYSQPLGIFFWFLTSIVLLNSKRIVENLFRSFIVLYLNNLMNKILFKFAKKYKTYLSIFSIIPSIYILIYFIYHIDSISGKFIFPVVFIVIVLFVVALYNKRRPYFTSTFYIYLNFVMFFVLSFHSKLSFNLLKPNNDIVFYSTISLILIISLFLILRKSVLKTNGLFFNGFDLSVIILTSSIFIIDKFVAINDFSYLLPCFVYSIMFYFWYKILVEMYPKLNSLLYYLSFSLPIVAVIVSIF